MPDPHTPIDQMLDPDHDDKNRPEAPQPADPARALQSLADPDEAAAADPTTKPADGPPPRD